MSKEPYPFDFRNAGTTDGVVRLLRQWLGKATDSFADNWEAVSDTIVDFKCNNILTRTFEEAVNSMPMESIGFEIAIGNGKTSSLASISIQDTTALIGAIFGVSFELEEERKLTNIEISLCQMIYETVAKSLSTTWLGLEPVKMKIGKFEDPPHFSRLIPQTELVHAANIELKVAETVAKVLWMIPRDGIETLFESTTGTKLSPAQNQTRELVSFMPIELVTVLGSVEMPMGSVSDLEVGDLMMLDQKIDQPVSVLVDQQTFYEGWPGRVGKRQAVEIAKAM